MEGSRGVSYESRTTALRTGTETCRGSQGFYVHAIAFVGVNIGLFTINTLAGGAWWFFWPLMGWGIGLGAHALTVFGFGGGGPLGRDWEEHKTKEILGKEIG